MCLAAGRPSHLMDTMDLFNYACVCARLTVMCVREEERVRVGAAARHFNGSLWKKI